MQHHDSIPSLDLNQLSRVVGGEGQQGPSPQELQKQKLELERKRREMQKRL